MIEQKLQRIARRLSSYSDHVQVIAAEGQFLQGEALIARFHLLQHPHGGAVCLDVHAGLLDLDEPADEAIVVSAAEERCGADPRACAGTGIG